MDTHIHKHNGTVLHPHQDETASFDVCVITDSWHKKTHTHQKKYMGHIYVYYFSISQCLDVPEQTAGLWRWHSNTHTQTRRASHSRADSNIETLSKAHKCASSDGSNTESDSRCSWLVSSDYQLYVAVHATEWWLVSLSLQFSLTLGSHTT